MVEIVGELDTVKEYVERVGKPLADLRAKALQDAIQCRHSVNPEGVAIGISPCDNIIDKYSRGEITDLIYRLFKKIRARGSDGGRMVPIAPLALFLVGEYSPKHRWHYHGIIKVDNIVILDKIKKRINRVIGRCVTEDIRDTEKYIDYMFKQYTDATHSHYYVWDSKECYIHYQK